MKFEELESTRPKIEADTVSPSNRLMLASEGTTTVNDMLKILLDALAASNGAAGNLELRFLLHGSVGTYKFSHAFRGQTFFFIRAVR